jgi:hypothetical protein
MSVPGARKEINTALLSWEGVTTQPHRFGGTEYRLGRREIGHVHGNRMVDIPFPKAIRDEVVQANLAEPHHILPDSGWISFYLHSTSDIPEAISLLRRSFELAVAQKKRKNRG